MILSFLFPWLKHSKNKNKPQITLDNCQELLYIKYMNATPTNKKGNIMANQESIQAIKSAIKQVTEALQTDSSAFGHEHYIKLMMAAERLIDRETTIQMHSWVAKRAERKIQSYLPSKSRNVFHAAKIVSSAAMNIFLETDCHNDYFKRVAKDVAKLTAA